MSIVENFEVGRNENVLYFVGKKDSWLLKNFMKEYLSVPHLQRFCLIFRQQL